MKNITKHIPNLFTLANLCCGVLAIILFMEHHSFTKTIISLGELGKMFDFGEPFSDLDMGVFLILLALAFDFLDGFMAKILKAQSPIGAQLDSLADMITFGVAPGILVYVTILEYYNTNYLAYLAFLIPMFSALRLAKFNVDTEQTDYFKGIPTPANAMFWVGLVFSIGLGGEINPLFFYSLIIIMSLLMMSNMKMLSFKFKNLAFKGDNIYRYLLIVLSVLLTITCALLGNFFLAIPLVIILYILLSIPYHFSKTKHA